MGYCTILSPFLDTPSWVMRLRTYSLIRPYYFPIKWLVTSLNPHEIAIFAAQRRWTNTWWKSRSARVPYLQVAVPNALCADFSWFFTCPTVIKHGNWESSIIVFFNGEKHLLYGKIIYTWVIFQCHCFIVGGQICQKLRSGLKVFKPLPLIFNTTHLGPKTNTSSTKLGSLSLSPLGPYRLVT